jgi:hypothetical protein
MIKRKIIIFEICPNFPTILCNCLDFFLLNDILLSMFLALAENGGLQEFTKANNLFTPAVYKVSLKMFSTNWSFSKFL